MDRREVEQTLQTHGACWREEVFTPLVTLYAFLGQVFAADGSCRAAVARVLAWLICCGERPCSANTGGYCQARVRLPEAAPRQLMRLAARRLHEEHGKSGDGGLLGGRPVKIVDGSTVSMPDTDVNQSVYPQAHTQKPGLGFPIARIVALFGLYSGAALDAAIGPYLGKQTGENALFRGLLEQFDAGDVAVADCAFGSFWNFAMLQARGVDAVFPLHQCRPEDFSHGKRLGKHDCLVEWRKPRQRPDWMDRQTYQDMPEVLSLRQFRVHVDVPGFRVKTLVLVTTLLDPKEYPIGELAAVYRARWHAELDLRSIKCVMQMDVLRCKSPAMVRKEFWMRLLAYNLIRTVMAQAAEVGRCEPRRISFTGAWQTLDAFSSLAPWAHRDSHVYAELLRAIASHRVGGRLNRVEPRAVKRRSKPHPLLTEPRKQAQARLMQTP